MTVTDQKRIKIEFWRNKRVDEMSKDELIEALNDAYNLLLEARRCGVRDMVDVAEAMMQPKINYERIAIMVGGGIAAVILLILAFGL